jgi:uncharacterized repeat protein (TIGR02543 family)
MRRGIKKRSGISTALAIIILFMFTSFPGLILNSGFLKSNDAKKNKDNQTQFSPIENVTKTNDPNVNLNELKNVTINNEPDQHPSSIQSPTNNTSHPLNYTLTVKTPEGSGSNTPEVGNYTYSQDEIVQAKATPFSSWRFDHWILDASKDYANPVVMIMNSTHTLKAVFTRIQYNLTISVNGLGTTSPIPGTYLYANGTQVSVNATASEGWKFNYWVLDDENSTDNPTNLNMVQNHELVAVFTLLLTPTSPPPPTTFKLTIQPPDGSGSTNPGVGDQTYNQGTSAEVTATPASGWVFDHWSLDNSTAGNINPITVTMDSLHTLDTVFTQIQYTLTVNTSGQGSVAKVPSQATYTYGLSVQLTATPASGWVFSGWSGGLSGTANPATVIIDESKTVTATFTQNTYSLTVNVSPSAGGTVTRSSNGPYHLNDVVTLTEAPSSGYTFSYWSGDGTGTGATRTVTMNGNKAVTATFTQITYTLTISTSGSGSTSPSTGRRSYGSGSQVQVTATPASGWYFSHWHLDGVDAGSSNPTTVTMNSAHTLQAVFTQITYTLTISVTGSGSTSPAVGSHVYSQGSSIQVTASPVAGWSFDHWVLDGSSTGSANPYTVTMNSGHTLSAVFTQSTYTLTVSTSGQGSVSKVPSQATYAYGSSVQLTATPSTGWSFSGWSGGASGTANPLTIVMNDNKAVTATFTQNQYTLTVNTSGQGSVAKSPSQATYTYGASVQLTATPAAGWSFAGWSGDLSGSVNPATLTVNGNKAVTATFTQIQYTLTIQSPDGSGSTSPAAGSYTYNQGALAQVTATPSSGWIFDRWLIDEYLTSQENPINVGMDSAHKIKAIFILLQYTLVLSANGLGTTSPSIGTHTYNSGSQIIVSATPNSGWQFTGWSGDLSGSSNPASITMNGDKTVTAIFTQIQYTLTIQSPDGLGSTSPAAGSYTYNQGASVQVTATPSTGWQFSRWTLDGSSAGSANPITVTMGSAHTLQAVFNGYSAKYIVYKSGTTYYAKSGTTGQIVYSGTVASTVIQSAINGLTAGRISREKILLQGDFTLTKTITIANYMILELDGKITLGNSANQRMLYGSGKSNFEIRGGEWDGNKANQMGYLYASDVRGFEIESCTNFIISGVTVHDTVNDGIALVYCSGATIDSNLIYNCAGSIGINFTSNSDITNNTCHDNSAGIYLYCEDDGIVQHADNNMVTGNTVYRIYHDGIRLYPHGVEDFVRYNTVTSNTLYDCGTDGLHISIGIGWSPGTVTNTLRGNADYNICTHNTIYDTGAYVCGPGVFIKGIGNEIAYNSISNMINTAMCVTGSQNTVENNVISVTKGGNSFGIELWMASNCKILNNTIDHPGNSGVWLVSDTTTCDSNTIDGNSISSPGNYGILISAGNANTVTNNKFYNTANMIKDGGTSTIIRNNTNYP